MIKVWKNKSTKTLVSYGLYDDYFGEPTEHGGCCFAQDDDLEAKRTDEKYVASCDTHNTYAPLRTKTDAIFCARHPCNFCQECRDALEATERKANV